MDEWIDGCMGLMDEGVDGWMDGWGWCIDDWMDGWVIGSVVGTTSRRVLLHSYWSMSSVLAVSLRRSSVTMSVRMHAGL